MRPNRHNEAIARIESLTSYERQILAHIVQGETNKDLGLSGQTVHNCVSVFLQKLNLNNRAEEAAFAVRYGTGQDTDTPL